jgi:hypothetical protein
MSSGLNADTAFGACRRMCSRGSLHLDARAASVALRTTSEVTPKIVAVKLEQVESVEEDARVVALVPDAIERRDPVVATPESDPALRAKRSMEHCANCATISQ